MLLAIVTSPLTFSIAIVAIAGLVAAAAAAFGITVGAVAMVGSLVLGGLAMLYVGAGLLVTAPMTGLFYLGIGLAAVGGFMVCLPLLYWLVRLLAQAAANLAKFIYRKIQMRKERTE